VSNWRLAKSLEKLRQQINAAYPNRDHDSDGTVGDLRHQNLKSDHNPNAAGVVTAMDTDEDLSPSIHSIEGIVTAIRASKDPRVKYIIYEGRITVEGSQLQRWKPYTGTNPHNHHAHISVSKDPKLYDDDRDWQIGDSSQSTIVTVHDLKRGDKGDDVKALQERLNALGYNLTVDADFGPATERSVRSLQNTKGLRPDGIVGANTRHELGL
jgi:hypothetical protein